MERDPTPKRLHFLGRKVEAYFTVEVPVDEVPVAAYGRYVVPRRFRVHVSDPRFPVTLSVAIADGRAECVSISSLTPTDWLGRSDPDAGRPKPDGLPIPLSGKLLRSLPLAGVLREVTAAAAHEQRRLTTDERTRLQEIDSRLASHDGEFIVPLTLRGLPGLQEFDATAAASKPRRSPKRGQRITDQECEQVATVYRKAVIDGQETGKAVADEFHVVLSTARRRIQIARQRGFLGPANGRRAGER